MDALDALWGTIGSRFDALDTDAPAVARDATRSPASQLGHLAWSRGLDYWSSDWPESVKRQLIAQTPANLRLRGTRAAIDSALSAFAADLTLTEWFETDPVGTPGTMNAEVAIGADLGVDVDSQDLINRLIEREGRKSIHTTLIVGEGGSDAIAVEARARIVSLYHFSGTQL